MSLNDCNFCDEIPDAKTCACARCTKKACDECAQTCPHCGAWICDECLEKGNGYCPECGEDV